MELLLCRMYICFPIPSWFPAPIRQYSIPHIRQFPLSNMPNLRLLRFEMRFSRRIDLFGCSDPFEFLSWCLNPGLYHLTVSFLPACVFLFPFSEKCSHCSRNSIALFFSFRFVFCQKELEQRCYNAKTESQNCTYLQYCLKHQNAFRILYIFCG